MDILVFEGLVLGSGFDETVNRQLAIYSDGDLGLVIKSVLLIGHTSLPHPENSLYAPDRGRN